jgi:ATP-dependent Clp protease protease subunit
MMNNHSLLHPPEFDLDTSLGQRGSAQDHDDGQRTIWLNEPVTSSTAQRVVDTLLRFESAVPGVPIHLYIYSPGGCVISGLAIVSTMQHISSPVYTYAIGYAASMGAVILAAGQPDHRYILPSSFVMIHQGSGEASGTMDNLRATLAFQSKLEAEVFRILRRGTGQTDNEICEARRVDNWMDAETAKSFGLVDHILEPHPAKS